VRGRGAVLASPSVARKLLRNDTYKRRPKRRGLGFVRTSVAPRPLVAMALRRRLLFEPQFELLRTCSVLSEALIARSTAASKTGLAI
jgi:hypothetical protein